MAAPIQPDQTFPPFKAEYSKIIIDHLKHLTTLSTGSILLEVAFLEKFFPHPKWKALVIASLLLFACSVILAVISMEAILLVTAPNPLPLQFGRWASKRAGVAMIWTWRSFVAGIVVLAAFAIRNWLAIP